MTRIKMKEVFPDYELEEHKIMNLDTSGLYFHEMINLMHWILEFIKRHSNPLDSYSVYERVICNHLNNVLILRKAGYLSKKEARTITEKLKEIRERNDTTLEKKIQRMKNGLQKIRES